MLVVSHCAGERRGNGFPDARFAPSSETLIDCHPLAVLVRHVAPGRAGANAPQNPVHDLAAVLRGAALSTALRGLKILQQPPFLRPVVAGLAGSADQTRIEAGRTTAPPRRRRPHQICATGGPLRAEACLLSSAILGSTEGMARASSLRFGEAFDMRGNLLNRTHSVRANA